MRDEDDALVRGILAGDRRDLDLLAEALAKLLAQVEVLGVRELQTDRLALLKRANGREKRLELRGTPTATAA